MDRIRGWWKRVRGTLLPGEAEQDMADEMRAHLEMEVAYRVERGMDAASARRAAHVAFGGVERHAERVREVRHFAWLEALLQDARHAVRSYRRTPAFTALVVVTLGVGIGGAVAIFSVVDAVVLQPLPYAAADRLVHVQEVNPDGQDFTASEPNFLDFAAQTRTLAGLGAYRLDAASVGGEAPEQVRALAASRSLADVLDARVGLGRMFSNEEDLAGGGGVVVLSDAYWRRRHGGDPGVVGSTLVLQGEARQVVGVLSPDFSFLRADVWVPLGADPSADRTDHWLGMVGRLAPDATLAQAQAELEAVAGRIGAAHPEVSGWSVRVAPLSHVLVSPETRRAGLLLLGAVGFLLLITCANVANLLLARSLTRQMDFGVRIALGAGAKRIARQTLAESGVLALCGGVLGTAGAFWAVAVVRTAAGATGADGLPRMENAGVDLRVLAFAVATTLATALLLGWLPSRQAARVDVQSVLKQGGRSGGSRSHAMLRDGLVVCQVALAVLLLLGGGLMMRSLLRLSDVETGMPVEQLWTVRLEPLAVSYPEAWQRARFFNTVTERVQQVPGVVAAGATVVDPFSGLNLVNDVTPEERATEAPPGGFMQAAWRVVTPSGFFEAADLPLLQGRLFSFELDAPDAEPVIVITRSLAERLWPGMDAVGRRLLWGGTSGRPLRVIGVVGDFRDVDLDSPAQPTMFLTTRQITWPWMVVMVRTSGDLPGAAEAIRQAIHEVDPGMVVPGIRRVRDSQAMLLARPRLQAWTMLAFALLALALAAVGLYGVLAFSVAERTREIGLRMAVGAEARDVLAAMILRGLVLTGVGLVLGLAGGALLSRLVASLLYDTAPLDPVTFVVTPVVLLAIAVAASLVPAWRAARVDPLVALRSG